LVELCAAAAFSIKALCCSMASSSTDVGQKRDRDDVAAEFMLKREAAKRQKTRLTEETDRVAGDVAAAKAERQRTNDEYGKEALRLQKKQEALREAYQKRMRNAFSAVKAGEERLAALQGKVESVDALIKGCDDLIKVSKEAEDDRLIAEEERRAADEKVRAANEKAEQSSKQQQTLLAELAALAEKVGRTLLTVSNSWRFYCTY
jgi:chromosome segregation ATPase